MRIFSNPPPPLFFSNLEGKRSAGGDAFEAGEAFRRRGTWGSVQQAWEARKSCVQRGGRGVRVAWGQREGGDAAALLQCASSVRAALRWHSAQVESGMRAACSGAGSTGTAWERRGGDEGAAWRWHRGCKGAACGWRESGLLLCTSRGGVGAVWVARGLHLG